MIYFFKAMADFLLPPGLFIILLLALAAYLAKKNQKISVLVAGIAALLWLCSSTLLAKTLVMPLEKMYQPLSMEHLQKIAQADTAMVVLGGGAVLAPDVQGEGTLAGAAANRMLTAARLEHSILASTPIILTGGIVHADGACEAEIAKRQLMQLGIAEALLQTENKSRTTKENAFYTAKIARKQGYKHLLLVTSAWHMPRSVAIFRKACGENITIYAYPCDYIFASEEGINYRDFLPSAAALAWNMLALHEYGGMLMYKV